MGLQHDNLNALPQDAPRTQRLTADESRAVIARWQQEHVEQTGLTDRPAVSDVAEGLDIPAEEVQRLLAEVRAQWLEEERALAKEQELSEIRLAEEERKLAEIRRQRAELRREQSEDERGRVLGVASNKKAHEPNPIGVIVGTILFVFWLCWMLNIVNISQHQGYLSAQPPAPACPPGMYPVNGQSASFGCTSVLPNKQDK